MNRREFLKYGLYGGAGLLLGCASEDKSARILQVAKIKMFSVGPDRQDEEIVIPYKDYGNRENVCYPGNGFVEIRLSDRITIYRNNESHEAVEVYNDRARNLTPQNKLPKSIFPYENFSKKNEACARQYCGALACITWVDPLTQKTSVITIEKERKSDPWHLKGYTFYRYNPRINFKDDGMVEFDFKELSPAAPMVRRPAALVKKVIFFYGVESLKTNPEDLPTQEQEDRIQEFIAKNPPPKIPLTGKIKMLPSRAFTRIQESGNIGGQTDISRRAFLTGRSRV